MLVIFVSVVVVVVVVGFAFVIAATGRVHPLRKLAPKTHKEDR